MQHKDYLKGRILKQGDLNMQYKTQELSRNDLQTTWIVNRNKIKEWGWDQQKKKAQKFNMGKVWMRKWNLDLTPFFSGPSFHRA